jgi:hypothetical protein
MGTVTTFFQSGGSIVAPEASPVVRKRETRTDAAGTYVAYTYADGHIETEPPGRPLYPEDIQRQRRRQAAPVPTSGDREAAAQDATAASLVEFRSTCSILGTMSTTATAAKPTKDDLLGNIGLGDEGGLR